MIMIMMIAAIIPLVSLILCPPAGVALMSAMLNLLALGTHLEVVPALGPWWLSIRMPFPAPLFITSWCALDESVKMQWSTCVPRAKSRTALFNIYIYMCVCVWITSGAAGAFVVLLHMMID